MRFSQALTPLLTVAVLATLYVLAPLLATFWIAFLEGVPGSGYYTIGNYKQVLTDSFGHRALWNTFLFGLPTTALAMALALPLAWVVSRTDLAGKQVVALLMGVVLIIPGFVQGMGWSVLLSPKIGVINRILMGLTGMSEAPFNIYTLWGMIFVQSLNLVPPAFFILVPVFLGMDAILEEAGYLSGANRRRVFLRINLPLALPAIAAATIYVLVLAFSLFEIPAILGFPHRIFVFSTMVYVLTHTGSGIPEYGLAAAYGSVLMILSVFLTRQYARILREGHRYVTISGRGRRAGVLRLGRWRGPAVAAVSLYFLLSLGLPLLTLVWLSLIPFLQMPSVESLSTMSFDNYVNLLHLAGLDPFINTGLIIVLVPLAVVILAIPISWIVVRTQMRARFVMDGLVFLPTAVPRIVLAVSFLYLGLVIRPFFPVYGSVYFIAGAYIVMYLSFATRAINGAITQIHRELEEAGRISGASSVRVILKVTVPLLKPALLFSWLWVMLLAFREVTVALMLNSPANMVLPVLIWNRWNEGRLPEAAAVAVLLTFIAVLLMMIGRKGLERMVMPGIA